MEQPQGPLEGALQGGRQGPTALAWAASQPGRRGRLGRRGQEVCRRVGGAPVDELGKGRGGRRLVELG